MSQRSWRRPASSASNDPGFGQFDFTAGQLRTLDEVERGVGAFGGDDDLAARLDFFERSGLGRHCDDQTRNCDQQVLETLHGCVPPS